MKTRRGISPFIATVVLVAITLAMGGVLYSQFREVVLSEVRNPSLSLIGTNVAPDGESMVLSVKNDGNVPVVLSTFSIRYSSSSNSFKVGTNATQVASSSGTATLQPGDVYTVALKTSFMMPTFSTFTVTVVGDQLARAFNVQA